MPACPECDTELKKTYTYYWVCLKCNPSGFGIIYTDSDVAPKQSLDKWLFLELNQKKCKQE